MAGRAHLYEGYTAQQVTFGVRVLRSLGVQSVVFTNAAGGINLALERGGLVLISDHINLQGANPLIGPNDDSLGPRFPDMIGAYSRRYRDIAQAGGAELGIPICGGRLCGDARAQLRNARGDPLSAHHRRGSGRHVHRAGSHRRQSHGHEGARHLLRHQHGGRRSAERNSITKKCWRPARMVRERWCDFLKALLPRLAA